MLTHTLNNIPIPLPVDFSMHLTMQSPVCDFEKIPFNFSLDFTLPLNNWTAAIFGHPERVAKYRQGNDLKIPGYRVMDSGATFMAGTIIVKVSGGSLSCTLIDLVGEIDEKQQEKNILEMAVFSEVVAWNNSTNFNPDSSPYCCFPIINSIFFKDKGVTAHFNIYKEIAGITVKTNDTYDQEVLSYCFQQKAFNKVNALDVRNSVMTAESTIDITRLSGRFQSFLAGEVTVVTPFFFLGYVLKKVLKAENFHNIADFIADDDDLKNVCIYNNFDITNMGFNRYSEYIYYALDQFKTPDNKEYVVDVFGAAGPQIHNYVRSYDGVSITPNNHLPKMSIGELLVSTQNLFNLVFDFLPNKTYKIWNRDDLLNTDAIDIDKYFLGQWFPDQRKEVALKFTREHEQNDQVFSDRFTDLSDRIGDIKDPVNDWPDLEALTDAAENEIRYLIIPGIFVEYRWITITFSEEQTENALTKDILGWQEISIGLQNGWYQYGRDEVEEIKTKWSTCYGNSQYTLVAQPGNQSTWKAKNQDFSPRLLLYRGNNQGGNQSETLSFEYDGDTGLIKKYWKRTSKWWANSLPMVGYFNFSTPALRSVIWNKCLPYRTRETAFMIQKLEVDLYLDHIGVAEVTAYRRD